MRLQGIGKLTDHDTYWRLTYDECGHIQEFAREGYDDPASAAFFVRRHYAQCLTCALTSTPVARQTPNVEADQVNLGRSLDDLAAIVTALRFGDQHDLADRLDNILRRLRRTH